MNLEMTRRDAIKLVGTAAGVAALGASAGAALASESEVSNMASGNAIFTPGTYTATADGFHGPVTLSVTVSEDTIESIDIVESKESLGAGADALDAYIKQVIENQSIAIDVVTGATITTGAFNVIMQDCMEQAGADMDAVNKPIEKQASGQTEKIETDVVIMGSGISGLASAVSASQHGAKVVILEKFGLMGGNAKFSLGSFMYAQVDENAEYHKIEDEPDTIDAALARWKAYMDQSEFDSPYPDYDRLKSTLIQTMYAFDWLEQMGVTFTLDESWTTRNMSMAQADVPDDTSQGTPAAKILQLMKRSALDAGAELRLNTAVTDLIVEDGKVVGVKAKGPDGDLEVRANAVILAAGGFAANQDKVAEKLPFDEIFYIGAGGATGDGIALAESIGAAPYEDSWVNPTWPAPSNAFYYANHYDTVFQEQNSPLDGVSESSYHRLMVDADGKRFENEAAHYALQNVTLLMHDNHPYWVLYSGLEGKALEIAESGLASGGVVKGDTLDEVAQAAGVDVANLKAAVDAYNDAVQNGVDDEFGKKPEYLDIAIGDGPYYMIRFVNACSDTLSGVKTNLKREVLDTEGNVIPGLYAVGSCSNKAYYNRLYFSGSALTFSTIDGRIAGAAAAGVEDPLAYPLQ